jgi:hypothetical protein
MRTLFIGLALGLAVCGNPQPFDPEIEVPLGEPFALRVDQSAEVSGTGLRFRFDGVREDSRCPTDVVCVWGGNARIRLTVDADGEIQGLELNTALDPRSATVDGFRIAVEALQPDASTATVIDPGDYIVAVLVTREP